MRIIILTANPVHPVVHLCHTWVAAHAQQPGEQTVRAACVLLQCSFTLYTLLWTSQNAKVVRATLTLAMCPYEEAWFRDNHFLRLVSRVNVRDNTEPIEIAIALSVNKGHSTTTQRKEGFPMERVHLSHVEVRAGNSISLPHGCSELSICTQHNARRHEQCMTQC